MTTLSLCPILNAWQGLLASGLPNNGGLIYTYSAGSTTPATVYQDSAGATPHANPIALDAGGRPPAEIWVNPNLAYKFAVTDSTTAIISTYDNITAGSALSGGTMTGAINEAPPVTLTAASTVAIGGAAANTILMTGSANIYSFDNIPAGAIRTVIYSGGPMITYNATSMILIGGITRTYNSGDVSIFESLGSGNWKEIIYQPFVGWSEPAGFIKAFAGSVAPSGYLACPTSPANISRTTYANLFAALVTNSGYIPQSCTISIASPGVITHNGHGFLGGELVRLFTTGALPTGLSTGVDYYVLYVDSNNFQLSATFNGTALVTSGTQSGSQTYLQSNWGLGDGSTTFGMPWFPKGYAAIAGVSGVQSVGQVISHNHGFSLAVMTSAGAVGFGGIGGNMGTTSTTSSTGGAANLAAGMGTLICVKY